MLHGEYGGDEGKLAFADDRVFYQHQYIYEACKEQGITFQVETFAPFRTLEVEPSGFIVYNFRVRSCVLGEGTVWGVGQGTAVDSTTERFEIRLVYTFL